MKMEMAVTAPISGVVKDIAVENGMHVEGEDLLADIVED